MMLNNYNTIDTFIELIPDIAFFKDVEGRYLHCNQALLDFMNISRDKIINKTDLDIFPLLRFFKVLTIHSYSSN